MSKLVEDYSLLEIMQIATDTDGVGVGAVSRPSPVEEAKVRAKVGLALTLGSMLVPNALSQRVLAYFASQVATNWEEIATAIWGDAP